jgi:hypothetical protein
MLIYLAHPIDQGPLDTADARRALLTHGHVIFDPARAWSVGEGAPLVPGLQAANHAVIRKVDVVLALVDANRLSIGVVAEIVEAAQSGVRALVVGDIAPSWALTFMDIPQVKTIEQALAWLEEQQT